MKARVLSRFGWLVLLLLLCGAALLVGITNGQMLSIVTEFGAMRGVHLGNVSDGKGWNESYFSKINGEGGAWPGAIVFMSDRAYRSVRAGESCGPIEKVYVPDISSHQVV